MKSIKMRCKNILLAVVMAAAGGVLAVDLPEPVMWWSMDAIEDGVVRDVSGNGYDLTLGADVYVTNMAAKGNALWFAGTTDTWAKRDSQPALTTRTLSFWIWRNEYPGDCYVNGTTEERKQSIMPMIFHKLSTLNIRSANTLIDDTKPWLGVSYRGLVSWYGDGGSLHGYYFSYNNYPQFMLGAWTHICYSIDVKNAETVGDYTVHTFDAKVYINGIPHITVTDGVTTNGSSSGELWVGNNGNLNRPFCGALDEVRIFDTALTPEQVAAEYARVKACHARLVAHYPLDEFSERDAGGSFTSPVTEGFMAGLGDGYEMTFNDHTCVTNAPGGKTAVHFDGTATTRGTVASIPYKLEDFTISTWLHMPTNAYIIRVPGADANYPRLFTLSNSIVEVHFVRTLVSTAVQYTVPGNGSTVKTFSTACLPKGLWQHLVFVYRSILDPETCERTGAQFEAWLNGRRMAVEDSIPWKAVDRGGQFTVGNTKHSGESNRILEGDVRDIRIYNGALSADDIEALYRGSATVDAGPDFTVNTASATLYGNVAADGNAVAAGYAGTVAWTQVSGPATATFVRAGNPVTEVALPVEGVYVFRLSAATYIGDENTDTVTVTRDDAATPTAVPAVDALADHAMYASLTNGLIVHYPVPATTNVQLCTRDEVSGAMTTTALNDSDWEKGRLDTGIRGYAMRAQGKNGLFKTGTPFPEAQYEDSGSWPPIEEWRTVAAWIYHDGSDETPWYSAPWFSVPLTLCLCYGKFASFNNWSEADRNGFSIQQLGISGAHSVMHYDLPYSISNRWTHVCAVVNRHDTTKSRFYLDGEELTASGSASGAYTNDDRYKSSYSNYVGRAIGGRVRREMIHIGSLPASSDINGSMTPTVSNTTTHAVAYRVFPGAVDDVRVYDRPLSADEIAYLAAHPEIGGNLAPYIGDDVPGVRTLTAGSPRTFEATAFDDGKPTADGLAFEWEVVSGDAANVTFEDRNAAVTGVTVSKAGTYSFRLKATDGERVTYGKTVVCEVNKRGTFLIFR